MDSNTADQPIAVARANISELLASVRLLRRTYFLTSRGKRQAAVVPAELGELVEQAGGPDEAIKALTEQLAQRGNT
ncbi:prevent-host-death family protein [Kitasatospora sp. NPDC054939]